MRKSLLTLAAALVAANGFAQNLSMVEKKSDWQAPWMQQKGTSAAASSASVKRTFADGTYYVPTGGLWRGSDLVTGRTYPYSIYSVAPFADITFKNMMSNPKEGSWTVNDRAVDANADGDFVSIYYPGGMFYGPVLHNGTKTYSYGDYNLFAKHYAGYGYESPIVMTDSIACLYSVDNNAYYQSPRDEGYYNPYQLWGGLDTDNMYGSGNELNDDGSVAAVSYGVGQAFRALSSPLYVDYIGVEAVSFSQPIAEGDTLVAYLSLGVDTIKWQSGGQDLSFSSDEIVDTLYATSADTLDFVSTTTRNNKRLNKGVVKFQKKSVDAFGNEITEPFVIPANTPFSIGFFGFDNKGIDCGLYGTVYHDEDKNGSTAITYYYNPTTQKGSMGGYLNVALTTALVGMFEKVYIPESGLLETEPENLKYNVLKISNDGTENHTADFAGTENDVQGAPVYTATAWADADDIPFYEVADLPEWVSKVNVAPAGGNNLYVLSFQCQPLPAGVSGRSARVKVQGRGGIASDNYIYLLQGDATIESGINDVKADSKKANNVIYNLKGQQVSKAAKGILIQNGKKFFNK